ncbi:MAG TPA: hypothetical protein VGH33_07440 [Isosphaeraceae bacterium]
MERRPIEFVIDFWETSPSGQVSVIGRCGDRPIRVGEAFDVVYSFKPRLYPEGLAEPPVVDQVIPVSLAVEGIDAYERSLPELGEGMTGRIVLNGRGLHHVAPGWMLGRSECLSWYAARSAATSPRPAEQV